MMAYFLGWAWRGRKCWLKILFQIIICLSLFFSNMGVAGGSSNETDRLSLLAFKAKISDDPFGIMRLWNDSVPFCQWFGVTCSIRHQRVTGLNLFSLQLGGSISPHIGNLSFLNILNLQNNSFIDQIPPEIGRLGRLQLLVLNSNSIGGGIPANLSACSKLTSLFLHYNKLEREIPLELGSLVKLQNLTLAFNNLSGAIPASLGNLTSLQNAPLGHNNLIGRIPVTFGGLKHLRWLDLYGNLLSGEVPVSIYNLSYLESLDIGGNQLEGSLPSNLFQTLANIQFLSFATNQFTGRIPISLSNASNLGALQLTGNRFYGKVPSLQSLNMLWLFSVASNQLGSGASGKDDLSFLCSLTNATSLLYLLIRDNNFGGILPSCITSLSSNLILFRADNNNISGSIPAGIHNLISLESLTMANNSLTNIIPPTMENLKNLALLDLSGNKLSGPIPSSLGKLSKLTDLILSSNILEGTIPSTLQNCKFLQVLQLDRNKLTGSIPPQVLAIRSLSLSLTLSDNQLSGPLPIEVGMLTNLYEFRIASNMLSGEIPGSLGECTSVQFLDMGGNNFQGPIPSSLSSMKGLQFLNLADNKLSGQIPQFLAGFQYLVSLNLSFNDLQGVVPKTGVFRNSTATSLQGNNKLCGGIPDFHLPACTSSTNKKRRRLSVKTKVSIATIVGFACVALLLLAIFRLRKRPRKSLEEQGVPLNDHHLQFVSYGDLHKATNGFSEVNLVGAGSFGCVFKGTLGEGGQVVAIKVLNLKTYGASRSFIAECEALRNIRHRNLVKLLTVCSGIDYQGNEFKALVYEFMSNGSLEDWLHPLAARENGASYQQMQTTKFGLNKRLSIAIDIASLLEYVHHHFGTPLVHCDIKPSNILLDGSLSAYVSDFGLAKFLSDSGVVRGSIQPSSSIGVRGTVGYAPPEYGMGSEVSTKGDVYSYGILLLEMFTGKRPTNDMFKEGLTLHLYAQMALAGGLVDIVEPTLQELSETVDQRLVPRKSAVRVMDCLMLVIELGVACSHESPVERIDMGTVATKLRKMRDNLFGGGN